MKLRISFFKLIPLAFFLAYAYFAFRRKKSSNSD